MGRVEGWEGRLARFFEQGRSRRFEWGSWDCLLMASSAVMEVTGMDPAAPFRGLYSTRAEAFRRLRAFAGGGLIEAAEKIAGELGFPETVATLAQRGDIVLAETQLGDALGAVGMDGRFALFAAPEGMTALPVSLCRKAWRL